MAIRDDQRKALEALGYKIGKSGNTVMTADGRTVGGFNENGGIFSGSSKVRDILKSKPAPAAPAPKPAAKPRMSTSGGSSSAPSTSPRPKPRPAAPPARTPNTPLPNRAAGLATPPVPGRATTTPAAPPRKPDVPMPARAAGLATPSLPPRTPTPKPKPKPRLDMGGPDYTRTDAMGNAYRKGGMVAKPKTMAAAMKKYEDSAADMKADKAGAKKMMGKAAPAKGKPMPAFMKKGK